MRTIEYSVLSYSPSIAVGERINVGILFHLPENNLTIFEHTKKWSRLSAFDDELDIEFVKLLFKGIEQRFESNLSNYKKDWVELMYNFANEFRFSSVNKLEIDEPVEQFIEGTKKFYLRYDFPKDKRHSDQEMKRHLRRIIDYNKIETESSYVEGIYNEKINYDFTIKSENKIYGLKSFCFDEKNISRMITSIRAWVQIAQEMKPEIETVFLYDDNDHADHDFKIAMNILKSSGSRVVQLANAGNLIDSIASPKIFSA